MFLTIFKNFFSKSSTCIRALVKKYLITLISRCLKPFKSEFTITDLWTKTFHANLSFSKFVAPSVRLSSSSSESSIFNLALNSWSRLRNLYTAKIIFTYTLTIWLQIQLYLLWALDLVKRSLGEGVLYLRGLFILFFFDAALTDDEPLWEPIEWSLTQSWIMFIFMFAWIGENLISSRYGSYTGRDKRVWFSWYKTFWLVEGWYILSLGATALFVIIPFYHELTYTLPLIVSWWNWYSRIFIFKFIGFYSLILYIAYYLQMNIGTYHWRKLLFLVLLVNISLSYLLYTHFFVTFFAYFTDPNWYHKTRLVDYIQLSHEPNKWSWGNAKRDHFSYHKSTTVFWFKNDIPFASALLLFHVLFFICLFSLYLYWLTLFRRIYTTQEVTFTYTTYCVAGLRQFYYYFSGIYILVLFSFVTQYWRSPIENSWVANSQSFTQTIYEILINYWTLFLMIVIRKGC